MTARSSCNRRRQALRLCHSKSCRSHDPNSRTAVGPNRMKELTDSVQRQLHESFDPTLREAARERKQPLQSVPRGRSDRNLLRDGPIRVRIVIGIDATCPSHPRKNDEPKLEMSISRRDGTIDNVRQSSITPRMVGGLHRARARTRRPPVASADECRKTCSPARRRRRSQATVGFRDAVQAGR